MTHRAAPWLAYAAALVAVAGCDAAGEPSPASPATPERPAIELLDVPHPNPDEFKPEVAASLRPALETFRARAASRDGASLGAAYGKLGLHYQAHQQQSAAGACFANAMQLDPDDHRWPYHLAVHFEETGRFEAATEHYARSLELEPDNLAGATRLGLLHLKLGELDDAQARLESVVERRADHAPSLAGLADIAHERGDDARAVELYERALAIDPQASQLYYRLGLAYRELGDVEKARSALARRGERVPFIEDPLLVVMQAHLHPPDYYVTQADGALDAGDARQAARLYSLALLVTPTHAPALTRLGELLLAVNRNDEARERFEQLVDAHPDLAIGHYYLGLCAVRAGRRESAIDHMREALRREPGMARATRALERLSGPP